MTHEESKRKLSNELREEGLAKVSKFSMPHRVETFRDNGTLIMMGEREDYRFWDVDGREFIDFHLNGGVFNLGHLNERITQTLRNGLDKWDIGNHHFPSLIRADLSEKLAQLTPGDLRYSIFAPSGGEAIDIAIKSARRATGRRRIVGIMGGYHGRTGLSGAAGDPTNAESFLSDQPSDFSTVGFNDLDALEREFLRGGVAAVLVEPIPATLGFPMPAAEYLPGIRRMCDEFDALLIADEVQTGMGRTGHLWAVERWGVEPDVLVAGKGLGGGLYPVSVAVLNSRAGQWLEHDGWGYASSAGGSELGLLVASEALAITTSEETRSHVQRLIDYFKLNLSELKAREPFLKEVRQEGLVIGLVLDHPRGGELLNRALFERGVWAYRASFNRSVLQFKPGLLIDFATCDRVMAMLELALAEAKNAS